MSDLEDKKILSEAEKIKHMIRSDGWSLAKGKLMRRLADMGNILNYVGDDPETFFKEAQANQKAIKIIQAWFKDDLEGEVLRIEEQIRDDIEENDFYTITSE